MKVLADMHVAPPLRRWMMRLGLALVVAIAIGYVPGQLLRRDPRARDLEEQLEQQRREARELAAGNAALYRDVERLPAGTPTSARTPTRGRGSWASRWRRATSSSFAGGVSGKACP